MDYLEKDTSTKTSWMWLKRGNRLVLPSKKKIIWGKKIQYVYLRLKEERQFIFFS